MAFEILFDLQTQRNIARRQRAELVDAAETFVDAYLNRNVDPNSVPAAMSALNSKIDEVKKSISDEGVEDAT